MLGHDNRYHSCNCQEESKTHGSCNSKSIQQQHNPGHTTHHFRNDRLHQCTPLYQSNCQGKLLAHNHHQSIHHNTNSHHPHKPRDLSNSKGIPSMSNQSRPNQGGIGMSLGQHTVHARNNHRALWCIGKCHKSHHSIHHHIHKSMEQHMCHDQSS